MTEPYDPFARPVSRMAPEPERLFEFIRARDLAPMSCELVFSGEPWGWEARFLERGELLMSHGTFPRKADAIACGSK